MPGSSSQGIFLSYRREDATPHALFLRSKLSERLPGVQVFMDLDSIEAGLPFAEVIRAALASCTVQVALIGRQWLTVADEQGQRRLDDPDDLVRFEVQAALERGVRVIPVLVDGASPPRQQQLPSGLGKLAGLNAHKLNYDRYQYDADRLVDLIQRVLTQIRDQAEADRKAEAERQAQEAQARPAPKLIARAGQGDDTGSVVPARQLVVQVGDQRFTFGADFTAGRLGELVVDDESVSGHHASFRMGRRLWYVDDLGSVDGTWLNGRRIRGPQFLKQGDEIRIGQTVIAVVSL